MFCEKCGAASGTETPDYTQPQSVQPYPAKPQGKSTAAIVIYMISGVLAVLGLILPFLPHIASTNFQQVENYSMFGFCLESIQSGELFGGYVELFAGNLLMCLTVISMILQFIWAILSFVRVKAAGIFGVIGSCFFLFQSLFWLLILFEGAVMSSHYYVNITIVPMLMVFIAIAGIVFASLQLAKKDYVK